MSTAPGRLGAFLLRPLAALLLFAAAWGLFLFVLHPWLMGWGATADEQTMPLPGDTAPPSAYLTRAITIGAPASAVWPWLLAIGQDRAGFLSNDYLENLTGADIHNADTLRPEWRQRAVGDKVPMASPVGLGLVGESTLLTVRILQPERLIGDIPGRFVLVPLRDGSTRLLLREALDIPERRGAGWLIWDPMHFVMEQRLLQGVKERAEGVPLVPPVIQAAAHVGWAVAALGLLLAFLSRPGWRPWALLPMGVMVAPFLLARDVNSLLAGFLSIGITLVGFLAYGRRWWAPYLVLASAVALSLLLASDSYAFFGVAFLALELGATAWWTARARSGAVPSAAPRVGAAGVP